MSADNSLTILRTPKNEFLVVSEMGDGHVGVLAQYSSYEEAVRRLEFISSEEIEVGYVDRQTGEVVWLGVTMWNDEFVQAEHGIRIPSLEDLLRCPAYIELQ